MEDCIFCKIVKGELPSFKIYEDEKVFAFEDINPLAPGHTLVIPKAHAANIWEISEEDLAAIHIAAKKIAHAIQDTFKPAGVATLQLNGRAVNQLVMHYHLHLIPRAADGPELSITDWELKAGDMDTIKAIGDKIAAAIK
jgi:histidine triad (HIT) family protein